MKIVTPLFTLLLLCACTQQSVRPNAEPNAAVIANINLSVEYIKRQEYEIALEKLDRARQIDPGYYATYNIYGLIYQQLGSYDEAERNFKKALKLNKDDPATLNYYAQFLCQTGKVKEAEREFIRAADNPLYQTPEIALANAGTCAHMNNREADAEKYFRRALDINPRLPRALLMMSELSHAQNNYLSARGYLQRYLEVAKHTPKSLWLGIRIEQQLGDKDAVSSYALSLKNNFPDSEEARLLQKSSAH